MKKLHTLWLCIFLTGYFAVLSAQQVSQNKIGDSFVSNECLIKFKPTTNRNIIDSLGSVIKFTILEYYPDGKFYRVRIPSTTPVHLFISRLLQSSAIECAQPDYFISFFSSTSDLVSSSQWYLSSSENGGSNIDAAQKFIGGISSDLSVAIIDGGLLPDSISDFFKDARVLPKIIAEPNEEGRISRLIESIWHCLNNGARIITINAGAPDSPLLQNAIMQ
ncbi:MAG TPA: hypothetical protein VHO70_00615, partial [Chitinispirillaceae bacterium]|nr:hypothetical protein [Chitinispirillaceae bacterium]